MTRGHLGPGVDPARQLVGQKTTTSAHRVRGLTPCTGRWGREREIRRSPSKGGGGLAAPEWAGESP